MTQTEYDRLVARVESLIERGCVSGHVDELRMALVGCEADIEDWPEADQAAYYQAHSTDNCLFDLEHPVKLTPRHV